MISEKTKLALNKHVDEYLDELRMEVICLRHNRDIKKIDTNKFVIQDTEVIIDLSQKYEELLSHPIEDYFIPEYVSLYVTEFIIELELPELVNLVNFDVSGVIDTYDIFLDDPQITDKDIESLIQSTCFDERYQNTFPEVRDYLEGVYRSNQTDDVQKLLNHLRPFLMVKTQK